MRVQVPFPALQYEVENSLGRSSQGRFHIELQDREQMICLRSIFIYLDNLEGTTNPVPPGPEHFCSKMKRKWPHGDGVSGSFEIKFLRNPETDEVCDTLAEIDPLDPGKDKNLKIPEYGR
ncbi:MAG: hypothetical protein K5770_01990 [Lachnospiraceae bacterium]|nr:hypothetical protein [Lachnospiraceae bacterium]